MKSFYVLAYDVPSDSRRRKIAKIAESFCSRINNSVFECVLDIKAWQRFVYKLERIVVPEEDKVRIYPLSASQVEKIVSLGELKPVNQPKSVLVL